MPRKRKGRIRSFLATNGSRLAVFEASTKAEARKMARDDHDISGAFVYALEEMRPGWKLDFTPSGVA